eukprot:jgi/Mesvir1/23552/Mv18249-RA.1
MSEPTSIEICAAQWNQGGTWEERCVTKWANQRLKELLVGLSVTLASATVTVREIEACKGEATVFLVRGKARHTYEMEVKLRWEAKVGMVPVEGIATIPEAAFGDVDDIQLTVDIKNKKKESSAAEEAAQKACTAGLLPAIKEKFLLFESELRKLGQPAAAMS